jgi:hypothetical protein
MRTHRASFEYVSNSIYISKVKKKKKTKRKEKPLLLLLLLTIPQASS